jgi:hypothetical protein
MSEQQQQCGPVALHWEPNAAWRTNGAFSPAVPMLQSLWDSTSLGALKECPRKYYYNIVLGFVPRAESVHLTFGQHYHSALECYDHAKANGADHDTAVLAALRHALTVTWNNKLQRPWDSDDNYKNRETLVRTVLWYLDIFREDPFKTVQLANGKPAVELSFQFNTSYSDPTGSPYLLCGHMDRVAEWNDQLWIMDRKTTKSTISTDFFAKFSPDNQFTLYTLAGKVAFDLQVKGIIVDGAQVAVTFSRFARGPVERHASTIDEWYQELGGWLQSAEQYALAQHWPMNDKSCGNYGGCPYRSICSKAPSMRAQWLKADFVRRTWDPSIARGDI